MPCWRASCRRRPSRCSPSTSAPSSPPRTTRPSTTASSSSTATAASSRTRRRRRSRRCSTRRRSDAEEGGIDNLEVVGSSYVRHVMERFGSDLSGLKLAVDCANGAYSAIAPKAFEELGAEVVAIGDKPDGPNINVGCGATDLRCLATSCHERRVRSRGRLRRGRRSHAGRGRARRGGRRRRDPRRAGARSRRRRSWRSRR